MRYQDSVANLKFKRDTRFALIGPETFLKASFIEICGDIYPDIPRIIVDDFKESLEFLGSEGLYGNRVFIFKDFTSLLIKYLDNQDIFILDVSDKVDLKSKYMTELLPNFNIVECNKFKEYNSDYPLWIISYASEKGYSFLDGAEDLVYEKIGPDMFRISKELEKLFIIKGNKIISRDDVDRYISTSAKRSAFDLFEALSKKDIKGSLIAFDSYISSQDSVTDVVHFLGKYMDKLYRILLLKEQKMNSDDIADIVGIPRFLVKTKYLNRALSLGSNFIIDKIDCLCNLDAQLRLFKGDKNILFKKFIMDFAV